MLQTNPLQSVARFIREFNYSDNLFSKSFLEYLFKHHQTCFKEKKKSISTRIEKIFIPNVIKVEVDSENTSKIFITTFNLKECNNYELIESYNQLNNLFSYLSSKHLASFIYDLNKEFVLRFNKTPFVITDKYQISWEGRLEYLNETEGFVFVEENEITILT